MPVNPCGGDFALDAASDPELGTCAASFTDSLQQLERNSRSRPSKTVVCRGGVLCILESLHSRCRDFARSVCLGRQASADDDDCFYYYKK